MNRLTANTVFANRYVLIEPIGKRAYSESWKARDQFTSNTLVAIKVYFSDAKPGENFLKTISREYAITLPLNHPHLLKATYFDLHLGSPYLVLPLCEQGNLKDYLSGKILLERELIQIMYQMSDVLSYLHSKDIFHLHIKPENILLRQKGYYVLSELGLTAVRNLSETKSTRKLTLTRQTIYDSPEKKSGEYTAAADIYALGAVIYQLAVGDFTEKGTPSRIYEIFQKPLPPSYSRELTKTLIKCLSIHSKDRPSARELLDWSDQFLNDQSTISSIPHSPSTQTDDRRSKISIQTLPTEIKKITDLQEGNTWPLLNPASSSNLKKPLPLILKRIKSPVILYTLLFLFLASLVGWKYYEYHTYHQLADNAKLALEHNWYHSAIYYLKNVQKKNPEDSQISLLIDDAREKLNVITFPNTDTLVDITKFSDTYTATLFGTWQITNVKDIDLTFVDYPLNEGPKKLNRLAGKVKEKLIQGMEMRFTFYDDQGTPSYQGLIKLGETFNYQGKYDYDYPNHEILLETQSSHMLTFNVLYLSNQVFQVEFTHGEFKVTATLRKPD